MVEAVSKHDKGIGESRHQRHPASGWTRHRAHGHVTAPLACASPEPVVDADGLPDAPGIGGEARRERHGTDVHSPYERPLTRPHADRRRTSRAP
jgi:hypothetical protein